ncbi:Solute carrier family 35 member G1 [Halotydeus destructor]|nr:Solute carrier family 35 member G1 [Halotydeus destructor]
MDRTNNEDSAVIRKLRKIPLSGALLAIVSAGIFATASFFVKKLPEVHSFQVVVFRSIVQLAFYGPVVQFSGWSYWGAKGDRTSLFLRGVIGFVSFSTAYSAYYYLPLGDASAITFSAPVFVSIFACVILGEVCSIIETAVILFTLGGVVLISKPTFIFGDDPNTVIDATMRMEGTIISLVSSLAHALAYIVMRRLKKTPAPVVIAWFSIVTIILGTLSLGVMQLGFGYSVKSPLDFATHEWLYLLANGVCGIVGQLFLTVALKLEEAGLVSLARTSDIIFAFAYQVAFLGEAIHWTSLLGAAIVIGGVTISCIRKIIHERKEKALNQLNQS